MKAREKPLLDACAVIAGYLDGFRTTATDARLDAGEILGLSGPNGSGKSTFILTLLELHPALAGQVVWQTPLKRNYLPQANRLPESLPISVAEILCAAEPNPAAGLSAIGDPFAVQALLDQSYQRLSGGQKQRVLLTRSFLGSPDVLVLDEPCNHLDAANRALFWQTLRESIDTGRIQAALVIDHDLAALNAHAHQIVKLTEAQ